MKQQIQKDLIKSFFKQKKEYKLSSFGCSMSPIINQTNTVVFDLNSPELSVGDIVFFRGEKMPFVAHRLIEISVKGKSKQYLTKGDNLKVPDKWIDEADIYGRAIRIVKKNYTIDLNNEFWKLSGIFIISCPIFQKLLSFGCSIYNKLRI